MQTRTGPIPILTNLLVSNGMIRVGQKLLFVCKRRTATLNNVSILQVGMGRNASYLGSKVENETNSTASKGTFESKQIRYYNRILIMPD